MRLVPFTAHYCFFLFLPICLGAIFKIDLEVMLDNTEREFFLLFSDADTNS